MQRRLAQILRFKSANLQNFIVLSTIEVCQSQMSGWVQNTCGRTVLNEEKSQVSQEL